MNELKTAARAAAPYEVQIRNVDGDAGNDGRLAMHGWSNHIDWFLPANRTRGVVFLLGLAHAVGTVQLRRRMCLRNIHG